MKIEAREEGDFMILDLQGKLLLGDGVELLREEMEKLIRAGHTRVALNLAGVPYLDSAGLGEIVRWYTSLRRKNGNLRLLNLNTRIRDLLTVAKLVQFFEGEEADRSGGSAGATSSGA